METVTQQDPQNLSLQVTNGSGQDHIKGEEFLDPLAQKTGPRPADKVEEEDQPSDDGSSRENRTDSSDDEGELDPPDDLDQNSLSDQDLPADSSSGADDLPELGALDDVPEHKDTGAIPSGPEDHLRLDAGADAPEPTPNMVQGAEDLETSGDAVDAPSLSRSLRIDPSAFEIDADHDPATHLQGSNTWKAYTSGAMSPEQQTAFESQLQSSTERAELEIGFANTDLGTEKNTQEKNEAETQQQLTVDQEAADKVNKGEQYKTWKARDKKIETSKTRAAYQERKARKDGDAQQELARQSTQSVVDAHGSENTEQQQRLRRQSQRESQTIKTDANQRKRQMVAKAEQEEKEKYWYEKAWDYVASAWERIKGAVTSMIDYAWAQASRVLRAAERAISDLSTKFSAWAGRQWDTFKQNCSALAADIESFVSQTWESAKKTWSTFRSECSRRLRELKTAIVTTFNELADKAQKVINDGIDYMKKRGAEILISVEQSITHAYSEAYYWWDRYEGAEMSAEEELFLTPEDRAEWLFRAVRGMGADTTMVLRCLEGNVAENQLLAAALKKNHGLDLVAVLKDELDGVDLAQAMDLVEGGKVSLHNKILRAIGFWGADSEAIIALFESASDSDRKMLMQSNKADVVMVRERMRAYLGQAVLDRLFKGVDTETGELKQTPEALLARLTQRGAGLGTDEAGMYKDLTAFAKKNPKLARSIGEALQAYYRGEHYRLPSGTGGKICRIMLRELSGRDLDKAATKLLGGGIDQASAALKDETKPMDQRLDVAIDELFRPVQEAARSEAYRNGTDEAGFNTALADHHKAVQAIKTQFGDEIHRQLTTHAKFLRYTAALKVIMRSELNDADFAKATAMLDHGQQSNVDKIREEVEGMVVNNRIVMDAVAAMSPAERTELKGDTVLLAKIESGIAASDYARLEDIIGLTSAIGDGSDEALNNMVRLAAIIADGAQAGRIDQLFSAVLEAQELEAAGKLVMIQLRDRVQTKVGRTMPRVISGGNMAYPHPTYGLLWAALDGKRTLTSSDRVARATVGGGTDEDALKETIKDLKGEDLLNNWTNINEFKEITAQIESAVNAGNLDKATLLRIEEREFILDIHPVKLALLRSETGGEEYTGMVKDLRQRIRDASKSGDPAFKEAITDVGLKIDDLYREKMEYIHSVDEKRVHRDEGMFGTDIKVVDGFSTKGDQTDDAHGAYMGTLRTGLQAVERGEVTAEQVIEETNKAQAYFEERLKAYKDMKSSVANTLGAIAAAVVTIVVTVLTAGAGAAVMGPLLSAALSGGLAGAAGATAGVILKEVVQGGSYDLLEQGGAEVVMGAVTGAITGAIGKAFEVMKPLKGLSKFADDFGAGTITKLKDIGLGGTTAKLIGNNLKTVIPEFPKSLMTTMANEPVAQMMGDGGLLKNGWEGLMENIGTAITSTLSKDLMLSMITSNLKMASSDDVLKQTLTDNVDDAERIIRRQMKNQIVDQAALNTVGFGYDYTAAEGRMTDEQIQQGLLNIALETAKGSATDIQGTKKIGKDVSDAHITSKLTPDPVANETDHEPTTEHLRQLTEDAELTPTDQVEATEKLRKALQEDHQDEPLQQIEGKTLTEGVEETRQDDKLRKKQAQDKRQKSEADGESDEAAPAKVKTSGVAEDQLTDVGRKLPEPLTGSELSRVGRWQELRNQYLKTWREKNTGGFSDGTQDLLWGSADRSIRKNMTPDDLAAVLKEKRGVTITSESGKVYDHLQERAQAMRSIEKQVAKIQAHIQALESSGTAADGEVEALQEKVNDLSTMQAMYGV